MSDIIVIPQTETVTIELPKTGGIIISDSGNAVTTQEIYNVVVEVNTPTTIVAGQAGPAGPIGLSEDSMAYARETDFATESLIYKGEAEPGSLFNQAVWRIRKLVISEDGDVSEKWADGNSNFDKVWDNRASLTYP